jgi:hypothetical protein
MQDGKPAANLFAAGEIMAGNILGQGYLGGVGMTIGKIADITLVKLTPAGHCRKHGAEPLTITTCIANLHHPSDFASRLRVKKSF